MIGRLRQLSEPRLRLQGGIEKSQTPVERDILVQWVRKFVPLHKPSKPPTTVTGLEALVSIFVIQSLTLYFNCHSSFSLTIHCDTSSELSQPHQNRLSLIRTITTCIFIDTPSYLEHSLLSHMSGSLLIWLSSER